MALSPENYFISNSMNVLKTLRQSFSKIGVLHKVVRSRGWHSSCVCPQKTLAIYREEYNVWESRAPLSPAHVQTLTREGIKVLVQPSSRRAYTSEEYEKKGAIIREDIAEADLIIGVKKPSIHQLIPDKTYLCFSNIIKGQPENIKLLDAILEKNIRLVDFKFITDPSSQPAAVFSKYAGVCGMINILHGLGMRLLALGHHTPFMYVGAAHNYPSTVSAKAAIYALGREIEHGSMPKSLGPLIFVFIGSGNVSQGAQEVFKQLPHEFVSLESLKKVKEYGDTCKVYGTVVSRQHHLVHKDGKPYSDREFAENPQNYEATFFEKAMPYATCLVNGMFWVQGMPRFITNEQVKTLHPHSFNTSNLIHEGKPELPQTLLAVANISVDLEGSLEFCRYTTSIEHPFIIQNLHTGTKSYNMSDNGIMVMTIENLPAQVPRESSYCFGSKILPLMKDCLKIDGKCSVNDYDIRDNIRKAMITHNGHLTDRFKYIESLRKNRSNVGSSDGTHTTSPGNML